MQGQLGTAQGCSSYFKKTIAIVERKRFYLTSALSEATPLIGCAGDEIGLN